MTKKRIEQQNIDTIHLVSILFLILCPIIGLFPLYFVNKARNKFSTNDNDFYDSWNRAIRCLKISMIIFAVLNMLFISKLVNEEFWKFLH